MSDSAGQKRAIVRNPRRGARVMPLYHQVYLLLRDEIAAAQFDPDTPLSSEMTLADRYSVSRITIRKTLQRLEEEGLVHRIQGKGTYPVAPSRKPIQKSTSTPLESIISFEKETDSIDISWDIKCNFDARIEELLGSPRCLSIVRLRRYRGTPISFTTIHVPEPFLDLLDQTEASSMPIIHALEAKGIIADISEQTITAIAAPPEAAEYLGVTIASPLIVMRRLMLTADGTPVLHQESRYAPDRFEYRMTLSRKSNGTVARWAPIA